LAEVISKVAREGKDIETTFSVLLNNSQIIDANEELSKFAGMVHAEMRPKAKDFGLAEFYVLATASKLKSKFLTGDPHFKNVTNALLLT